MNVITPTEQKVGARKVDVRRGSVRGDVSAQWFARPSDQRYLSLDALYESVAARRDSSFEEVCNVEEIRYQATREDSSNLIVTTTGGREIEPTHYSFSQICGLVKAPASYLRRQHAFRAAFNLQADTLDRGGDLPVKLYGETQGNTLRAATGPDYGRIYDADLVAAVQRIAGNGTGDTRWKVPGMINWGTMSYNPYVDITSETTTLYASDRDVFLFLVDDTHPIEVGKLANGDPDLIFRGFYAYNSEVGARSLGIASFWLRAVCQNRNLWGVEGFDHLRIVHSRHGNNRFVREAQPALERYARSEPTKLLAGITAARNAIIGSEKDDHLKILTADSLGFSMKAALNIIDVHEREEGRPPVSVWDLCMGITAVSRTLPNTDDRIDLEKKASKLMDRAARNAA